jgi:hypothetical protein
VNWEGENSESIRNFVGEISYKTSVWNTGKEMGGRANIKMRRREEGCKDER